MTALPPAISQVGYPGAGDIDDCWAVASIWAAHAADPAIKLPTVPAFRAAAHNPDKPGPTAGDLSQIVHASVALWPDLPVLAYSSLDWSGFAGKVKAGSVASLAVASSRLPSYLRFGFLGAHQVGVIWWLGEFFVMNPLMHDGDTPMAITEPYLETAARGADKGWVLAALYQPVEAPVQVTDPTPKIVDLAVGVQCYAADGKTPLVKIQSGGKDIYSPYGNGAQRAVVISTGGVRQVAMVALTACRNIRDYTPPPPVTLHKVTVDGVLYLPTGA